MHLCRHNRGLLLKIKSHASNSIVNKHKEDRQNITCTSRIYYFQRRAEGGRKGRPSPPKVILGGDCLPPKFPDNLLKKCILEIYTFSLNIYGLNYYKKR